ncbi:hypothetical protein N7478_000652 [Penicillium angulare]|uniref:uncharacterized protein n=1 Tax=Penicillium angulare TaxID=116970 RepID=UPI002540DEF6|nr:uncharacterized protein N7478_000652 [Penicillium angulare]KAJ5291401.1 hypothetical protein N7478_000652 [Penicillium angulare]
MALTSNEKRAQRRQQCREALAAHINVRLKLSVAPSRVRLQPSAEDGYAWSVAKTSAHLLETSLSNGTVGLYNNILEELGRTIEAVDPKILASVEPVTQLDAGESTRADSFTAIIQKLERENDQLKGELTRARTRGEELLSSEQKWVARTVTLEQELRNGHGVMMELQEELKWTKTSVQEAIRCLQRCPNTEPMSVSKSLQTLRAQ